MSRWRSRMTLSRVSVPVLSVQRTFIDPRFWMEDRFLMMVFFLLIATAPLARQVVTIIGSISGVSPTAIEMAKSSASIQSSLVMPLMTNTMGTMTSMKRINNHETELMPFSKPVGSRLASSDLAIPPKRVWFPVRMTTASALPLMTLLPMKARLLHSVTAFPSEMSTT